MTGPYSSNINTHKVSEMAQTTKPYNSAILTTRGHTESIPHPTTEVTNLKHNGIAI